MKETHYIKESKGCLYIRRKSDGGIAFVFPNSVKGRMLSLLILSRLHESYDGIFFRLKRHLERIGKGHLIKKEHWPDQLQQQKQQKK